MSLRALKAFRLDRAGVLPEAVGMSLAELIAVLAVAVSNWERYDRLPAEFETQVEAAERGLTSSVWPETEREQFALVDVPRMAALALGPIEDPEYEWHGRSPLRVAEHRPREPVLLAVQQPRAVTRRTILYTRSPEPVLPASDPAATDVALATNGYREPDPVRPVRTGRGLRYVTVTGVVPHRMLVSRVAAGMRVSMPRAEALLDYRDVQIERQRIDERAPDGSVWQRLDLSAMLEFIRNEWDGVDEDVVPPEVTHPVFTMPLPPRAMGTWQADGTHPFFESEQSTRKPVRRATTPVTRSRSSLGHGAMPDLQPMMADLPSAVASTPTKADALLFRFVDCEVVPEATYRYRMRLVVRNPLFGLDPARVANPDSARRETLETPWSDPTPPVTVEPDAESFLVQVQRRNGRESRVSQWDVIQWNPELGTLEAALVRLTAGQQIHGWAWTDQLNVLAGTLGRRKVPVFDARVVVDTDGAPGVSDFAYPDLDLDDRGLRDLWNSHQLDEALLVTLDGRLNVQSPPRVAGEHSAARARHDYQMHVFAYLNEE